MAIRRCPYCKAIIDEGSEYCSNCGTQLIFPEDEFVEEEIPGEKIIDVNDEKSEPQEEQNKAEGEGPSKEREKGKQKAAEASEKEEAELVEEQADSAEIEVEEAKPEAESDADEEEITEEEKEQLPGYVQEDTSTEPLRKELLEPEEDLSRNVEDEAEEEAGERAAQDESADFRTADLEGMVDPAEKEREEIEKFLDSLKEERERTKKYYEETGELPPWAQSMREKAGSKAVFEEEEFGEEPIEPEARGELERIEGVAGDEETFEEKEAVETEEPEVPAEPGKGIITEDRKNKEEGSSRAADTGMGLPEGVDQQRLPFGSGLFESVSAKDRRRRLKKSGMPISSWVKSRIFDLLIVVGVWLVAIYLASRLAEIGFFQLLTASTIQTLLFLVILLIIYFFLFLFFLGETLGDHIFSEES